MIDDMGRRALAAAAFAAWLGAGPACAMSETIQPCDELKAEWSRLVRELDPSSPALAFVPDGESPQGVRERATDLADVQMRVTCHEDFVSRAEVAQVGPGDAAGATKRFVAAATALFAAFDVSAAEAADTVASLRAQAEGGGKVADAWGAYELTYAKSGRSGGAELILDRTEN